mmetsp:Transcript_76995/g.152526  ORF Transcript_76995/g.152526 Transcript_76995/m.152526 type:complete len:169 (+) Transcript_76995:44-550(+)
MEKDAPWQPVDQQGKVGNVGTRIEANRAKEMERTIQEVRAQRQAREAAAAKWAATRRSDVLVAPSPASVLNPRHFEDGKPVQAVRTNAAWMAKSSTFADSDSLRWLTPRKRGSSERATSERFAAVGAGSFAVTPQASPWAPIPAMDYSGYKRDEWPGPAGWPVRDGPS